MPEAVPPMIGAAFTSMIPVSVVIVISAILGQGIAGFDFLALINSAMAKLVVGGAALLPRGPGSFWTGCYGLWEFMVRMWYLLLWALFGQI